MPMLAEAETVAILVQEWLTEFEQALAQRSIRDLGQLFHSESHWRDLLALTWRIQTVNGAGAIALELGTHTSQAHPHAFTVATDRTPPRTVTRAGTRTVEAIFRFKTDYGPGGGVVRLSSDAGRGATRRAWTLLTALDELSPAALPPRLRALAKSHSRDFRGPNWLDLRGATATYADRDPAVLIVGGGQAGLSAAARLGHAGIDTLVVDRWPQVGDNWRKRYHALTLHNRTQVNHLPYMPFPSTWPTYIPKDKLAGWFEVYVEAMEINYWAAIEFEGGRFDETAGEWSVTLRRADGTRREMHPRHIVMATGVNGIPNLPDIPTLQAYSGRVLHSSQYDDGEVWAGTYALVVGTGNSGHDIAQDLYSGGAHVTLVQRSPTLVVNIEPSAQLAYALYDEGLPLDDSDLLASSMPFSLLRRVHKQLTETARNLDRDVLDGLQRVGFRLDFGEDGTGWQFKFLTRGGGYYFNVGCSDLIVEGKVGLVQFSDIAEFVAEGARMRSGKTIPADLIVLATGYKGQEHLVRRLFGADVVARVGPIWGFDEGDELRNMFCRTGQSGLWFIGGSLAQCRIYSKYLSMQIEACERRLIS
jgi:putative flavoprotein involved in K+ transport